MNDAICSTLIHTAELAVCLTAAIVIMHFFGNDSATESALLGIILAALAKFARASDLVPIGDYVNDQK